MHCCTVKTTASASLGAALPEEGCVTKRSNKKNNSADRASLVGIKKALIGGVIGAVIALSAQWLIGPSVDDEPEGDGDDRQAR